MIIEHGIGEAREDQFPIGMRVLAVDDDPTCLLLLETLLRRCQYKVTITSHAITALKMLRDNKNQFDLVISDVHMPDMDGFKLLELVGLEMDLPVIMLSANSDPKLVMKGITHGACDYLLKPVRIEELKNIWQHVIRRKNVDKKDQKKPDKGSNTPSSGAVETADQKLNKKRKDQDEDVDEDHDENEHENDDSTSQKKPRVVWSVDLHRKFVQAVNQLGIDKAVPKKILDLMNVDKLTRENVASHLQKYRLYLKRISTVANQQANMMAALGGTDASYLQMGSMIPNLTGPGQFQNPAFRPHMLGRLNSPAALGIHGLPSPGVMQLSPVQTAGDFVSGRSQFQPMIHPANNGSVLQGMPMSLDLGQIQSTSSVSYPREIPSNGLQDSKAITGSSSSPFLASSNNPLILDSHSPQGAQVDQVFGKQSSLQATPIDSQFSSREWSNVAPSTRIQSNSFTINDHFNQAPLSNPCSLGAGSVSSMALRSVSDISTLPIQLQDVRVDAQSPVAQVNGANDISALGWDNSMRFNAENEAMGTLLLPREGYPLDQLKLQGGYVSDNFGSLEDVVSITVKQEEEFGAFNPDRRHAYEI